MILFFDTETTGIVDKNFPPNHPAQPYLVQLGLLLTDNEGCERACAEVIVKPLNWVIPDGAAAVHGITTQIAEAAGFTPIMALALYSNMRKRAEEIVAYNLPFDTAVMATAFSRHGAHPTFDPVRETDCMQLATEEVKLPPTQRMKDYGFGTKFKPPKLSEAYRHFFKAELVGAHGALTDARACAKIFFEMRRLEKERAVG